MAFGKDVRVIVSPGGVLRGNVVYEQVEVEDSVQYAVKAPEEEPRVEPFLRVGEHVVYQPLSPSPWVLPPPPKSYGSLENLWKRVREYVYEHIDFEYDVQYDVYTAWVLASWTQERWDTAPYLWFTGPSNSGKTRCLDVLAQLVYRPLLSPSVSAASIYRALDSYHPTFLLDEFEMYEKMRELKAEVIGVLNAGYRRGQVVLRTEKVKDGTPVLKGFNCFGFKAISSIMELPEATRGRTIPFIMSRAVRKVKRLIDKEAAKEIRAMLLQYRFDKVLEPPPASNPVDLPDGRLIELYTPLIHVVPNGVEENILNYAKRGYEAVLEEERDTDEALVFLTIIDMLAEKVRVRIPQADIREKVNASLPEKEQFSKQKVGHILKRLGFKSVQGEGRLKEVIMDPKVLERRVQRYVTLEERERVAKIIHALTTLTTLTNTNYRGEAPSPSPSYPKVSANSEVSKVSEVSAVSVEESGNWMVSVKGWLAANRDEKSMVSLTALYDFIKSELGLDPQKAVSKLFEEGLIAPSPEAGKAIVV